MDGDEVVQVYLKKTDDNSGPNKTLRAFRKVHIAAGKTKKVQISLSAKQLEWWNSDAVKMDFVSGQYEIMVGGNSEKEKLMKRKLILQ